MLSAVWLCVIDWSEIFDNNFFGERERERREREGVCVCVCGCVGERERWERGREGDRCIQGRNMPVNLNRFFCFSFYFWSFCHLRLSAVQLYELAALVHNTYPMFVLRYNRAHSTFFMFCVDARVSACPIFARLNNFLPSPRKKDSSRESSY